MKERILKQCDAIIEGRSSETEINAADVYFASLINPKSFTGYENAELSYDKGFEKNCILLSSLANQPVKNLTTKEYFTLIQHYNKTHGRKSDPQGRYN
jgi:hypothetical protein